MKPILYLFMVLIACACSSHAFKILVISPLPSRSHYILSQGVVKHLTKAGHEITLVTAFPKDNPSDLVRPIDVSELQIYGESEMLNLNTFMKRSLFEIMAFMMSMMRSGIEVTLQNEDMQKLMSDPNEKFDLIIAEWMFSDSYAGLAAVFECPFIWLAPTEPHWLLLSLIHEYPNPSYTSDVMSNYLPPMSFIGRVSQLILQVLGTSFMYFHGARIAQEDYENFIVPFIRKKGKPIPSFDELRYNVSLVLGNSHVSIGQAISLPQSYKDIGGYHIDKEVKPLPQDLQNLMDNAKDGVVYFSMGSNLKSTMMPEEMKIDLLNMFGRLNKTVIWKFEEEMPNRPSNVHVIKWAPQPSILSHSNCVLFITHGGLLSTTEAVHYAVPIIGIPVFGDQFINVDKAVQRGYAKFVQLSYTMANDLGKAINEVISDPKYTKKVKELSFIYHHRPMSPGDELVHWAEHVILTKGAPHLRSPALLVPWYQKLYLDLVAVILIINAVLYIYIRRLLKKRKSNIKDVKDKTH